MNKDCPMTMKIQDLNFQSDKNTKHLRYGDPRTKGWDDKMTDGIQLRGKFAKNYFTKAYAKMIKEAFVTPANNKPPLTPNKKVSPTTKEDTTYHQKYCPIALYQHGRRDQHQSNQWQEHQSYNSKRRNFSKYRTHHHQSYTTPTSFQQGNF